MPPKVASPSERARTYAKTMLTKVSNKLSAVVEKGDGACIDELESVIEDFDKKLSDYDERQREASLEIEDEADMVADAEAGFTYREKVLIPRAPATKLFKKLSPKPTDDESLRTAPTEAAHMGGKLPKLELETFHGGVDGFLKWTPWWEHYDSVIHSNERMTDVVKFTYLRTILSGDAEQCISGLSLTTANYKIAVEQLRERYARPEKIRFAHIQELLNLRLENNSSVSLYKMYNALVSHVRSLDQLDLKKEMYGVILVPLILSRLPDEMKLEWAREEGEGANGDDKKDDKIPKESNLEFLLSFLKIEIERRDRSNSLRDPFAPSVPNRPSGASLLTCGVDTNLCKICDKPGHKEYQCPGLKGLPKAERNNVVKTKRLCYKCLSSDPNHKWFSCAFRCKHCHGNHNSLLCLKQKKGKNNASDAKKSQNESQNDHDNPPSGGSKTVAKEVPVKCAITENKTQKVFMQLIKIKIAGLSGGFEEIVCCFDGGSERSWISSAMVKKLRPHWVTAEDLMTSTFGQEVLGPSSLHNLYKVTVGSLTSGYQGELVLTEVPTICRPLFRPSLPNELLNGQYELFDVEGNVTVDVLIGLDHYWSLMTPGFIRLTDHLVLAQSVFGWILSGSGEKVTNSSLLTQTQVVPVMWSSTQVVDDPGGEISKLWSLESVGVCCQDQAGTAEVHGKFLEELDYSDNRYTVRLPWKCKDKLKCNLRSAQKRADALEVRLSRKPDLKSQYNSVLVKMEEAGVIHELTPDELQPQNGRSVFYLPHRPEVRLDSETTPVRPVFDGSAKGPNGISLNDCLETGPSLLPDLVQILVRFRRWFYGFSADISKAFWQVRVHADDRDVHRFIWIYEGRTRIMRFDRIPFGNKSSPFMFNAVLKYHLSKYDDSRPLCELRENTYVDDLLSGGDDDDDCNQLYAVSSDALSAASCPYSKGTSSSEQTALLFEDKNLDPGKVKALGLKWDPPTDYFSFVTLDVDSDLIITMRVVSSFMSKQFDPIGFLHPFTVVVKIIFQECWRLKLDWDDKLPDHLADKFRSWLNDLKIISTWNIPRRYFDVPWRDLVDIQLHGFGDASEKAYGCCIYIRACTSDGAWQCSLALGKTKLAPLNQKTLTLPRLELMGSLLCARSVNYIRDALKLPEDTPLFCWADSTVALAWIQGDSHRWKDFVRNRVQEIQTLVPKENFKFCPGVLNPADLVTRGVSAAKLIESDIWLNGPEFLTDPVEFISGTPKCSDAQTEAAVLSEQRSHKVLAVVSTDPVFKINRWGSYTKAIRVVGWVLRFIKNLKLKKGARHDSSSLPGQSQVPKCDVKRLIGMIDKDSDLTYEELVQSKLMLIHCVQVSAFPDEYEALSNKPKPKPVPSNSSIKKLIPFLNENDNLLRVGGRLQQSELSEDEKHPIIIPRGHFATLLVRHMHLSHKHAGVNSMMTLLRNNYKVVGARPVCKTVKRFCVSCQRQDSDAYKQIQAPLPAMRVKPSLPFTLTGVDHAGPLYCCDVPGQKFYILLFTCATIRAVHLELVDAMSAEITTLAVRRFMARRGMPNKFLSDNAKGFISAGQKLVLKFGVDGPNWEHIVERAPWWGGFWERLVGSIKSALRKCLGKGTLTRTELETTLHEVEACVNSRPLTYLSQEDGSYPITPAHFLIGRPTILSKASEPERPAEFSLTERLEIRLQHLESFWNFWTDEYIKCLPPYYGTDKTSELVPESLVLIHDENKKRLEWPLAKVIEVYPSSDGIVRSVRVQTANGPLNRPIQRLYKLEINSDSDENFAPSEIPEPVIEQINNEQINNDTPASPEHDTITEHDSIEPEEQSTTPVATVGGGRSRYGRVRKPVNKMNLLVNSQNRD